MVKIKGDSWEKTIFRLSLAKNVNQSERLLKDNP